MSIRKQVLQAYKDKFGDAPQYLVRAPGRVNLIGEHTDYNDGYVLPMAINRAVWIALRPKSGGRVDIQSLDFDAPIRFRLSNFEKGQNSPAEYVKGVAWALSKSWDEAGLTHEAHNLVGFEGVMKGDVPIGAGLSSSAALELAIARAFAAVSDITWNPTLMARLAQKAENQWVGVNSGIMDQMISAAGVADHALLIDCRTLNTSPSPIPAGASVVVLDTGTRRGLVDSAYNERRQQCEAAAKHFGVKALRDVSLDDFQRKQLGLDDVTLRRARHVITENTRVIQAKVAMQTGDAAMLGELFNQSHKSMRDDFEISSDALNAIVRAAQAHGACYGARMTGGGFAGCAVALVQSKQVDRFVAHVAKQYRKATNHIASIYVCEATKGASLERV